MNKILIGIIVLGVLVVGTSIYFSNRSLETNTNEVLSVKLFFPNTITHPNPLDCRIIEPYVVRTISYATAPEESVIKELIKGPNPEEIQNGFMTLIDSDTKINSFSVLNGTAYIDLSAELNNHNVGLCAGQMIDAQIRETLLQFPQIKNVEISIDGDKEFVQP